MEGGGDGWSKRDGFMVWHETFRRMEARVGFRRKGARLVEGME